jgi:hypothetical protein
LNIVGGHLIPTVLTSSEEAERLGLEAAVVGLRVSFVFFLWKRYQYFEA